MTGRGQPKAPGWHRAGAELAGGADLVLTAGARFVLMGRASVT